MNHDAAAVTALLAESGLRGPGGEMSDEAFGRVRAVAVAAFATRAAASAPLRPAASAPRVRRPRTPPRSLRIGLALVSLALASTAMTGQVLAESRPGHPLYGIRLALETLTLPPGDSPTRVDAQLRRLDARIREAQDAATAADLDAVNDAIDAYRATLRDIGTVASSQPERRKQVAARLARAAAVLDTVVVHAQGPIAARVGRAVAETCKAVRALRKHADDPTVGPRSRPAASGVLRWMTVAGGPTVRWEACRGAFARDQPRDAPTLPSAAAPRVHR